jgi:hypothetical protein
MSDFINNKDTMEIPANQAETETNTTNEVINTCVVGISSEHPYDTSVFTNNSTTFYTRITYSELIKLYYLIDFATKDDKSKESGTNTKSDIPIGVQTDVPIGVQTDVPIGVPTDMNMLYVVNCFSDPSIKMIFRFLCSSDCHDGNNFINEQITSKVYDFVKLVTRRNCIVEVSDHSMGSFFKNWNDDYMGIPNPIQILPITHSGSFKMYGNKNDFISSVHPTLKQIGNLSSSELVEITFNNMGGTKVFKIVGSDVKIISKGVQLKDTFRPRFGFGKREQDELSDTYDEVPVHSEFDYQYGKIVVSATHWCNLDSVETPVDLPTLRRYCTNSLGVEATQDLEISLSSAQNECEYKRIISATVRQISSGSNYIPTKKIKIELPEKQYDLTDKLFSNDT